MHNLFADHIDRNLAKTSDIPYQLNETGYSCDTDNLVAESNFVNEENSFEFPLFTSFSLFIPGKISLSSSDRIYTPLRGPPQEIGWLQKRLVP